MQARDVIFTTTFVSCLKPQTTCTNKANHQKNSQQNAINEENSKVMKFKQISFDLIVSTNWLNLHGLNFLKTIAMKIYTRLRH